MNRLLAAAAAALTILPLTALSAETADHVPFSELTGGSVAGTFTETRTIPGAERAFEMAGSFMTSPSRPGNLRTVEQRRRRPAAS